MALPKGFRNNIKLTSPKIGVPRRQELLDNIADDGTFLPRGVHYKDIDETFIEFVNKELHIEIDGNQVPVIFLTLQRYSEFTKTWQFTDEYKNIKIPFITIVRKPDVQVGTNYNGLYNIPGRPTFTYYKVPTNDGTRVGVDVYKIPQPTSVDITYEVRLFTNKMSDLNLLNEKVQKKFQSRQAYIWPKGHPMPVMLESIGDESNIDDFENRRFYVQPFEMLLAGYILDEDDFEIMPTINRAMVMSEIEVGDGTSTPITDGRNCSGPIVAAQGSVIVKNTNNTVLSVVTCGENYVVGNSLIFNSGNTYSQILPATTNLQLPNVTNYDSDGSAVLTPAMVGFTATTCQPVTIINSGSTYSASTPSGSMFQLPNINVYGNSQLLYSQPSVEDVNIGITNGFNSVGSVSGTSYYISASTINNSGNTFSISVPAESGYTLPNVTNYDSDGSAVLTPAMVGFTATTCQPVTIINSGSTYSASTSAGSTFQLPNITISNTTGTTITTIPSVENYIIPDVNWTDSDGTNYSTPYGEPISATTCDSLTVSATSSSSTVVFGDTVSFSAISESILTSVDWYVDGIYVGSGINFNWASEYLYGLFDVECVASNGSSEVVSTFQLNIIVRPYERPSDWLDIDSLVSPGDEKIVGLFAVFDSDSNVVAFRCQGNYQVDWGDGTVTTHASNTNAEHSYTYSSISSSTYSTRGYRQVIITITPQAGQTLTRFDVTPYRHSSRTWLYLEQWLDVKLSVPNLSFHQFNGGTNKFFGMLEKYVMIATGLTSYLSLMSGNRSLRHLEVPPITGSYGSILINCGNIEYFNHDFSNATTLSNAFQGSGLRYLEANVPNAVVASAFYQAYSLMNVNITNIIGSCDNMFNQCYSLRKANLTGTPTSCVSMFYNCLSLELPPNNLTCTSILSALQMFAGCASLKENLVGTFSVCAQMSSMYSGCRNLVEVYMFDMGACTLTSGMFQNCSGLRVVPTLDTSNVTNNTFMFENCYSLVSVGNLDFSSVTRWGQPNSGTFTSCYSLTELPTLDFAGTSTDTYGNYRTFQNMYSLRRLDMINTGAVTGWQEFVRSCSALAEIGPCSMSSGTNFSAAFSGCYNLRRMQGTGIKVSVSFNQCALDATAIDEIFTNLAIVVGQTITVSQNPGSSTCNTAIATGKGWTVII